MGQALYTGSRLKGKRVAQRDPDFHWWAYGNYTRQQLCPHCGRERLMECEDNDGRSRIICEKCNWEPAVSDYCYEALGN